MYFGVAKVFHRTTNFLCSCLFRVVGPRCHGVEKVFQRILAPIYWTKLNILFFSLALIGDFF